MGPRGEPNRVPFSGRRARLFPPWQATCRTRDVIASRLHPSAHIFCADELEEISPLPLISGVAPLDAHFARHGIKRIGLLGTSVVMRTRVYGQLARTEALALDHEIEEVGQTYQDIAVAGACSL